MYYKLIIVRYLITFISIIYWTSGNAQFFSGEQNPPSIKWRQINTENFQLVYPTEIEADAGRLIDLLEKAVAKVSHDLGKKPKKITIILQNQGTSANGFVQLAPRRSEFYATPSQSYDFQSWIKSLAIHELRHVIQFDKLTGRFNKPPLESLALAMFGITLPAWYYEGDAVITETIHTDAGRGRIPEWAIQLRANTLSDKTYSYSKNFFGSVKDNTPGYYQLGFFLTTKLQREFGRGINDSLLRRISSNPFRPYNFSRSVKKFTRLNTTELHDATIAELKTQWTEQLKNVKVEDYPVLNQRSANTPENYLLPSITTGGEIAFLKNSKAETPAIYSLKKDGKSSKLFNIGIQEIPWFSYAAGKIVWDEFRYDARFRQRSFNVVNVYDMHNKKIRQLTHRSRLFAPTLSADGKKIAAVEVSTNLSISIIEIDANSGKEIRKYPSPENYMLQMPAYNESGNKLLLVAVSDSGKSILELDARTGKYSRLMPFQPQEISRPIYASEQVIFKAHFNGIDNIYRLNPVDQTIYQLTSTKYGAHNPSFDTGAGRILFNTFEPKGYNISAIKFLPDLGTRIDRIATSPFNYSEPLNNKLTDSVDLNEPEYQPKFKSEKYREINNLFYFHSIIPFSNNNPFSPDASPGIRLQSDNKLNTLGFYTTLQFDNALRKFEYQTGFTYSKFFPVFEISYNNRARILNRRITVDNKPTTIPVNWREHEYNFEIRIPLTSNKFNNTYSANFKVGTNYTSRYSIVNNYRGLIQKIEFPLDYELSLSRNARRSARDLASRWGQNISFRYRHFPFDNQLSGTLFTLRSSFFFPGILQNHSTQASFNFQEGAGLYNTTIDIPRVSGYSFLQPGTNPRNTLLLDYRFPLFYPDWTLGPLAYIKRLKGGFFADFENIHSGTFSPLTFGAELRADMNILRFYLPNFDLGGRLIFINRNNRQNPIFESMISYNF